MTLHEEFIDPDLCALRGAGCRGYRARAGNDSPGRVAIQSAAAPTAAAAQNRAPGGAAAGCAVAAGLCACAAPILQRPDQQMSR